jgi:precorrin-2 dehydrogenase/sirohydrochlorin ferrochelatase
MGLIIDLQPSAGPALVVGGGTVAARKVRGLAEAGFRSVVVAPVVEARIRATTGARLIERTFEPSDIDRERFAAVFACTDSRAVNQLVGQLARARSIPVVVADSQSESTFFTPATFRDGGHAVAVSTGGASPALARQLRERVVAAIGPGWDEALRTARNERQTRLASEREEPTE